MDLNSYEAVLLVTARVERNRRAIIETQTQ